LEFEWDPAKASLNEQKHGLAFRFVLPVFSDPNLMDIDVSREADGEARRKAVGRIGDHIFALVYSRRGSVIRVISARRANVKEMREYGVR
jgi:uncharacterized DUF497 family protein